MGYTYVKQHDTTDCGAACMAMICSYYKKHTSLTLLRDLMGTDDCGTNLMGMQHCAKTLGFNSQAVRVDKEGFFSKYPLPAVANIVTKKGFSHFVVIFKINNVIINTKLIIITYFFYIFPISIKYLYIVIIIFIIWIIFI